MRRLRSTGMKGAFVERYVETEWRTRRMELPTKEEKAQAIIDRLISENVPADEITVSRLRKELGTSLHGHETWTFQMIRKARHRQIARATSSTQQMDEVAGVHPHPVSESAIDTDELDMRDGCGGTVIRRRQLRPDVAEIAWPLLCEAAQSGQYALSTISNKFLGYKLAGEVLGQQVPDVTKADLRAIQAAWLGHKDNVTLSHRIRIKAALTSLFSRLVILSEGRPEIDRREMLLIASWLNLTPNPTPTAQSDVLSADELDAVIKACLTDITEGTHFIMGDVELLSLCTRPTRVRPNASPLIRWGVALMILLMFLTGLRRQSVITLRVGDWVELHPGVFALIWRHGKKREERVAVLPASLASLLDNYAQANRELRETFGTDRLFIFGDKSGYWQAETPVTSVTERTKCFVKRHAITHAGEPITLGSQLARRTYVTRELYEGQSVWALRLQLGHIRLESTLRYGKFDMFEHPAQVGTALDTYGHRTLALWRGPVVLESLDAPERARLLGVCSERDQGVGLCRHESCKKINEGALPPCSLCEYLVTGREFFGAWDAEQARRERGIAQLEGVSGRERLLSDRRQQYALFKSNYERLKGEDV